MISMTEFEDLYSGTITRTGGSFINNTDVEMIFGTGQESQIVFTRITIVW